MTDDTGQGSQAISLPPLSPGAMSELARLAAKPIIETAKVEHERALEYLARGGYARHLHRLTKTYAGRRDALLTALRRHFGEATQIWGEQAGLHLTWFPPPDRGSPEYLATLARRHGLDAAAVRENAVLLGFGTTDELRLEAGVRRLADALPGSNDELPPVAAMPIGFAGTTAHGAPI